MLGVASQYICALLSSKHFSARANFPVTRGYPKRGFARAKPVLSLVEGTPRTPSDGQGLSSRANARDLRKISPGVYPELTEGVEMTMRFFFAAPSTLLRTCFAPLREIFRVLVAAPSHQVLRGGLFVLDPEFSLRFEEDREVRYFVGRNIAGYLVVSLGLVDQNT